MLRKFECTDCHHLFEADEQSFVKCPHCGSDNVDRAHFQMPRGWWKWLLALLVVACVIVVLFKVDWSATEHPIPAEPTVVIDTTDVVYVDSTYLDDDPPIFDVIPSFVPSKPVQNGEGYDLAFRIKNAPAVKYYVVLLEHNGEKVIARSEDGERFMSIPPSPQDGMYDIALFLASNDSILASEPIEGFKSLTVLDQRMTKDKLQQLLEDENAILTGGEDWLADPYNLRFTGLADGDVRPTKLTDVQMNMGGMWARATIVEVQYDDKNRIKDILIDIQKRD